MKRLRQRAADHQRSVQDTLREIVRDALAGPVFASTAELWRQAAEIRALGAGRPQTPSEELLRESRSAS